MIAFLLSVSSAVAQNLHGPTAIRKNGDNLVVTWTGTGTMQVSPSLAGPWQDILEARSPFGAPLTDGQKFFRVISRWNKRAKLIEANSEMGVAELNGKVYVIGELIYVAGGRPPRGSDFAVYNAANNTWQTLPNLPSQRNHLAACAIGGKIYVTGGRLQAGFTSAMTSILEVFDPATSQWTTRAAMPTMRGGINGIAANGRFLVFGGEGPNGVFDEMEMYVPEQDRWYQLESLPIAVHGVTGSAFVNGWIHLPGGGTATGGSSGSTLHQIFWVEGINP
ncbi:MAG: kelch-like protein [Verrucomicrobia bacterium]|nr:kelch-like protein [Verrucomicrobiota bacterium]